MKQKDFSIEIQSSQGKIPTINYLKGFSILTIVLMHLCYSVPALPAKFLTLSSIGGTGVHVFFLCSGIGLYISYLRKPLSFQDFLKKRFGKIYLPYILVVCVSFLLPWMYTGTYRFLALLSHIFLFKMVVPSFQTSFGIQFWFVSTIFQFYLLFIPLCHFKQQLKNNRLFLGICLAISMVWWISCFLFQVSDMRVFNSAAPQFLWEFAAGMVLGEYLSTGKKIRLPLVGLAIFAVLGIVGQALLALTSDTLKLFNDIPALLGYGSLALLLGQVGLIRNSCLRVASFSYELFLVHMLVINTLFYFIKPMGLVVQLLVALLSLVFSIGIAKGYHRLLQWKQ